MRGSRGALIGAVVMLIAVGALPAARAEAQEGVPVPDSPAPRAPEAPEPPQCICLDELAANTGRFAFFGTRRARLGVMMGEPATIDGRHGISLEEVPEGTPAHRAGLRTGDVIVAVDGVELGEDADTRLIQRMSDVEPGDTVTVVFLRDGREQTVRVATEAGPGLRVLAHALREGAPPGGDIDVRILRAPGLEGLARRATVAPWLELAAVNPELGEYFGTDRGVLVIGSDSVTPLGLRPGDVILAIGGREVQEPAHVRAILASYREGEEITFRIVRDRRTQEVTGRRS